MILVMLEHHGGVIARSSWEAVAAGQMLAGDDTVALLVVGADVGAAAADAASRGVGPVYTIDDPVVSTYTPDAYVAAVSAAIQHLAPRALVTAHTYQARDYAPALAARRHASLVSDVVGVESRRDGWRFRRPMFQGKLVAEVRPAREGVVIVTTQVGAFQADAVGGGPLAEIGPIPVDFATLRNRQTPEPPFREAKQAVDLGQAERIVAVGRGIKSQDQIAVAQALAEALGAELAASRPICDNGWLPMDRQVGSSGQTVAPKLYVALGISGAIQHLVGMKGSRTIVAVNKDADAPIFEVADYGIVGDLFEVVPALVAELAKRPR